MTYTVGTGFSGIGVPDLCARLLGMPTLWQIEKDAFCQKVLRKNFPEVETLYGDIYDVHQPAYVDIQVYGFPCQPFSISGKQLAEKDERFLIPEMLRVIDESRPRVLILENVPRIATLNDGYTLKNLFQALAQMGFDAEWGHISAEDVGAPHVRERWFCVAYPHSLRRREPSAGNPSLHQHGEYPSHQCGGKTEFHAVESGCETLEHADALRLQKCDPAASIGSEGLASGRYAPFGISSRWAVPKPRLGRNLDGAADWMDGFVPYPARPGEPQFEFEPPRTTDRPDDVADRLKALGNSMAVDVMFEILLSVRTWLETQDAS